VIGSADMNSAYMSASYLINQTVLVDIPGGVLRELKRQGTEETVRHVLITHTHADHTMDLPLWILKNSKRNPEDAHHVISLHSEKINLDRMRALTGMSFFSSLTEERLEQLVEWNADDAFRIGNLLFRRVPVSHGKVTGCGGYLVTDGEMTAGFTGDSCMCDGVRKLASSSDILFCDCDLITGNDKHMGIDTLMELHREFPDCRLIATHLKDETREKLKELGSTEIGIAEDGAVYGNSLKHKKSPLP